MQSAISGVLPDLPRATATDDAHRISVDGGADHHLTGDAGTGVFVAPARSAAYAITKRVLDLTLGSVGLLATLLVAILVAPLIKLNSPGPLLFRQTRLGKDGKPFTCLKFRTMHADAEERLAEIAHLNEVAAPAFKIANDPRHIPAARWLRKFSIDEMPQFWNVVRGDMSLVGPRPPLPAEVDHYTARQRGRLTVKPGLTCTWQVNGRSNVDFEHWVEMDLDYIERRSTRLDLALILLTIPAVISGRGAS